MSNAIKQTIKTAAKKLLFPVPSRLIKNQRSLDGGKLDMLRDALQTHYYTGWRHKDHYTSETFAQDLHAHLTGRLEEDRQSVIPWLDHAMNLKGKSVLEIGCGTGSSTVALSEQGAAMTGIDIDEGALKVAEARIRLYGLNAAFQYLNADGLGKTFKRGDFDIIIFFAALEHMTIPERLNALKQVWNLLGEGGLLIIAETPNRLWFFDSHTSRLPFYHWLPDRLAFDYARYSPEDNFNNLFGKHNAESEELFLRRGRGMSYHEIDLAIMPAKDLHVVSSLSTFQGVRFSMKRSARERRFKSLLRSVRPDIHAGFFDEYLYLTIRK